MDQKLVRERLCHRIAELLNRFHAEMHAPTLIESDGITTAIDLVSGGQYDVAATILDELRRLETMSPWNAYSLRGPPELVTTETLRRRLSAIESLRPSWHSS